MKTVTITGDFDGYPQGSKEGSRRETFRSGEERELPAAFADLLLDKGLAKLKAERPARPAGEKTVAERITEKTGDTEGART